MMMIMMMMMMEMKKNVNCRPVASPPVKTLSPGPSCSIIEGCEEIPETFSILAILALFPSQRCFLTPPFSQ